MILIVQKEVKLTVYGTSIVQKTINEIIDSSIKYLILFNWMKYNNTLMDFNDLNNSIQGFSVVYGFKRYSYIMFWSKLIIVVFSIINTIYEAINRKCDNLY